MGEAAAQFKGSSSVPCFTSSGDSSPHKRGSSCLPQFLFPHLLLLHMQNCAVSPGQKPGTDTDHLPVAQLGHRAMPAGPHLPSE